VRPLHSVVIRLLLVFGITSLYKRRYTKKSSLFQFIGEKCGLGELLGYLLIFMGSIEAVCQQRENGDEAV